MNAAGASPIRSGIYRGKVRHRRFTPCERKFEHSVCYFYLDLDEVPKLFSIPTLFSDRGPSLFGFRRQAYLGPTDIPLDQAVRDQVEREAGFRPTGPIRLLTQITYFGFSFNPVTFYYCFDDSGSMVRAIVAEITNTPWGERHAYVLVASGDGTQKFEFDKRFHVSPFLDMAFKYRWGFSSPDALLNIHMENHRESEKTFDATLTLSRESWSSWNVIKAIAFQPFMTMKTLVLIYLHAAIIYLRRIPFVAHPRSEGKPHPLGTGAIHAKGEAL
jgi:DUF1365 family protein